MDAERGIQVTFVASSICLLEFIVQYDICARIFTIHLSGKGFVLLYS